MQGVIPALRTFNTVIIACNVCNQPLKALSVYEEMGKEGLEANSTTCNALISAYGKLGQLEEALSVYKDMVSRSLERSIITYSSLIDACEKAGRWETALSLLADMQSEGCVANTATFNSLISACGQGALPRCCCPAWLRAECSAKASRWALLALLCCAVLCCIQAAPADEPVVPTDPESPAMPPPLPSALPLYPHDTTLSVCLPVSVCLPACRWPVGQGACAV